MWLHVAATICPLLFIFNLTQWKWVWIDKGSILLSFVSPNSTSRMLTQNYQEGTHTITISVVTYETNISAILTSSVYCSRQTTMLARFVLWYIVTVSYTYHNQVAIWATNNAVYPLYILWSEIPKLTVIFITILICRPVPNDWDGFRDKTYYLYIYILPTFCPDSPQGLQCCRKRTQACQVWQYYLSQSSDGTYWVAARCVT